MNGKAAEPRRSAAFACEDLPPPIGTALLRLQTLAHRLADPPLPTPRLIGGRQIGVYNQKSKTFRMGMTLKLSRQYDQAIQLSV